MTFCPQVNFSSASFVKTRVSSLVHSGQFKIMFHIGATQVSAHCDNLRSKTLLHKFDLSASIHWFKSASFLKNVLTVVEIPPVGGDLSLCFCRPALAPFLNSRLVVKNTQPSRPWPVGQHAALITYS